MSTEVKELVDFVEFGGVQACLCVDKSVDNVGKLWIDGDKQGNKKQGNE